MEKLKKQKHVGIFFLLMPLLICVIYTLKDGKMIWDIFIPANKNGPWSDEVFYYKQIEGIIHYRIPQGFFGYGEGTAKMFTFGPWSPFLLLPYAALGKIIGWNTVSPIWCNILFTTVAFGIIIWNVKKEEREKLIYCTIVLLSIDVIVRYILSGMVEPICIALAICMTGLIYGCRRNEKNCGRIILSYIIAIILTLMRPYNILFFVFPFYFILKYIKGKNKIMSEAYKKIAAFLLGIMTPIITLCGYFFVMRNFCSMQLFSFKSVVPQALSSNSSKAMEEVTHGSVWQEYFMNLFHGLYNGIYGIGREIKYVLTGGEGAAGKCWLYIAIVIAILVLCVINDYKRKEWELFIIDGLTLGTVIATILAFTMLSNVGAVGYRHILTIGSFAIFEIILEHKRKMAIGLILFFLSVNFFTEADIGARTIPYRDMELVSEIERVRETYAVDMPLNKGISWDNTVAWMIEDCDENGERKVFPLTWIFAVPKGYGIQLDNINQFDEAFTSLKSKYILVLPEYTADERLREWGAKQIRRTKDYVLYENPKEYTR